MPQNAAYQADAGGALLKAVNSIPAYIEQTSIILVLAPPATHTDTGASCSYGSWRQRGWCRME